MGNIDQIIELLEEVKSISDGLLNKLENGTAIVEEFSLSIQVIPEIIVGLKGMVQTDIYEKYVEYFESFTTFVVKCSEHSFLEKNVDELASSLGLFGECIHTIIEEYSMRKRVCACCGMQVMYKPLTSYYSIMKKSAGDYTETRPETLNRKEYTCSFCSCTDRDRMIVSFLSKLELDKASMGEKLLQIAPAKMIEHWIHGHCTKLTYHSTDLFMKDVTFQADVQNLCHVEDETYDYFICSHVLEHVQDDRKAMKELHRILKSDGLGIFLVPIDLSVKCTDEEWGLTEEENWKRFGQGDYCRKYARQDVVLRLKEAGFTVHELGKDYFGEKVFRECGLTDTSILYVLSKKPENIEELIERKKKLRCKQEDSNPLVSVILPTCNHEKYVEEAIESVLNQTYKNIEFLVADDGSTDGTVDKVLQYEDRIDQIHLFEENTGGNTGNFLRELATGKYVAVMHSDDVWDKDKLTMQVEYMEAHPECGACFTGCTCIEENRNVSQTSMFKQINMSKEIWLRYFYEHGNCLAHPSLLIHRELYLELQKQCGARMFRQLPDFWMWINLVLKKDIHVIERNLAFFRLHEKGQNQNTSARNKDNMARHLVEESYIWYNIFKRMDKDTFVKAFGDRMIRKEALSNEEILCEKMFILLSPRTGYLKQAGIYFMYDICQMPGIYELLEEKYNWTRKDMAHVSGELLS